MSPHVQDLDVHRGSLTFVTHQIVQVAKNAINAVASSVRNISSRRD